MVAHFIGEHEAAVLIGFPKPEPVGHLLMVCALQNGKNERRNGDGAAFAVLGGDDLILSLSATNQLQLLIYRDGSFVQVHAIPLQPQSLAFPHYCKQGDRE